ncbi:MAG: NeuD/PglB/VioB family sugar acetyltransferase [Defluviitaleaceae bacterium]|nr:NeuD/PglB/VioB family sugar acetyltransferase [Defluviitaleaceae bacterium]
MILGIYGSGGLGREILELARCIQRDSNRWRDIIFIDDYSDAGEKNGANLMSFAKFKASFKDAEISVALGEPAHRLKLYTSITESGFTPATLIHPTVEIPESTTVNAGVTICTSSFISCNVTLGENVCIQPNCLVFHDCAIEPHAVMSPSARLAGGVVVGEGAFIGMNATVKQQIKIGKWSIVGMSSSVFSDTGDESVVIGSPAKMLRRNTERRVF